MLRAFGWESLLKTGFIIKNHRDECTGIHTAGAYWLPTGGRGSVALRCVSPSCQLVCMREAVCVCVCGTQVHCVFMLGVQAHAISRATLFGGFFSHQPSPWWHLCIIYQHVDILPSRPEGELTTTSISSTIKCLNQAERSAGIYFDTHLKIHESIAARSTEQS